MFDRSAIYWVRQCRSELGTGGIDQSAKACAVMALVDDFDFNPTNLTALERQVDFNIQVVSPHRGARRMTLARYVER